MDELFIFLTVLAIGCVLSGPVALIISIIALNKSNRIYREVPRAEKPVRATETPIPAPPVREDFPEKTQKRQPLEAFSAADEKVPGTFKAKAKSETTGQSLEQKIGTQWVLIAGVITVIFGVGFFLKYAYDNALIGPLGRVVIAAVSGLVALVVGEVTRKRGYGIVAKGVTSLGFAILYAAVFSAYRFYDLINSTPAFVLSILVTAAAMLYAVSLNDVLIALLSLLGGFLTPVIVSTGENLPMPLFSYVLILGAGAMLCAYYRKWREVNLVAFAGTFVLYTGWFEKFFRPEMKAAEWLPEQTAIALGWLSVFFVTYLILPILYELVKKVKARREDVLLVLTNAAVTFYYLWTILFGKCRAELAFCALGLCVAHLLLMGIVIRRCKDDLNLRLALLAIGIFFLTIAVPLYLKMYAIAMAWAAEGVILTVIGVRYRSSWTQLGAGIAIALGIGKLLTQLPMHTGAFTIVFNPVFGSWCFVAGALSLCHILYRKIYQLPQDIRRIISQISYAVTTLLLMAAVSMEWYWHCDYNIGEGSDVNFIKGMMLIFTFFTLLLVIRPIRPQGMLNTVLAAILAGAGSIFTISAFTEAHESSFVIFANTNFVTAVIFVVGLFLSAGLLNRSVKQERNDTIFPVLFALGGIFVLWVLLTEEIYLYWYCRNLYTREIANWRFLSHMYISVMWAVYGAVLMVVGFWRKITLLRYISLGLFALLLVKVFIFDTSTVKNVYRIAAFLATGVTLVAVSYLYQFVKKKGFFEVFSADKFLDK